MAEKEQPNRWRCLISGCNPKLDELSALEHKDTAEHRVAKWPVRSAAGIKKANQRNKSGYYKKYREEHIPSRVLDTMGFSGYDEYDGSWDAHSCYVEEEAD